MKIKEKQKNWHKRTRGFSRRAKRRKRKFDVRENDRPDRATAFGTLTARRKSIFGHRENLHSQFAG